MKRKILTPMLLSIIAFVFLSARFCPTEIPIRVEYKLDEIPPIEVPKVDLPISDPVACDSNSANDICKNLGDECSCNTSNICECNITVPLPSPLFQEGVDFTTNSTVSSYSSNIKDIYLRFIKYRVISNTLNFDLPKIDIYIADRGSSLAGKSAIGNIKSIKAGFTHTGEEYGTIEFSSQQKLDIHEYLSALKFEFGAGASPLKFNVSSSKDFPKGELTLEMSFDFVIYVKPLD